MLENELIAFGLTAREAKVYVILLTHGDAPASMLAKRAGLSRVGAYALLDHLSKMNLVSFYEKRGKRFYRVSPPRSFLQHCDDEIISIQAKRKHLEALLPKLRAYSSGHEDRSSDLGRISFIRDRVLFVNRVVSGLKEAPEWYVIQDGSLWSLIVAVQESVHQVPKCLLPITEKQKLSRYVRTIQARYVPMAHFNGPVNLMIMGCTVMFIIEDGIEFFGIEIRSQEVACRLGSLFMFLWKTDFFDV